MAFSFRYYAHVGTSIIVCSLRVSTCDLPPNTGPIINTVSRVKAWGKHTGDFLGIPATGKEVTMTGIAAHRIANGKIVEHWGQNDVLGLFQQLGAFPPAQ